MLETTKLKGAAARRNQNRQDMRQAILDAAQDIIDTVGVEGLTIRAVAKQLGYSPGALYEYFDSKERILATLHHVGRNGLTVFCQQAVMEIGVDAPVDQIILALGRGYRKFALANQETFRLVTSQFKEAPSVDLCEDEPSAFDLLIGVVQRGIDEGVLLNVPPPVISTSLWIAVHGFVTLELNGDFNRTFEKMGATVNLDDLFEQLIHITLRGVLRHPEPGPSI